MIFYSNRNKEDEFPDLFQDVPEDEIEGQTEHESMCRCVKCCTDRYEDHIRSNI